VAINYGFEGVRAECAKRHGEEAKGRGNANKYDHFPLLFIEAFHSSESLNLICRTSSKQQNAAALQKLLHVRRGLAIRESFWSD
jgi:hypothetical protein